MSNVAETIFLADWWGMHDNDVGTGWMIVMMIGMLLFWGAIIFGVVWLIRGAFGGRQQQPPKESPSDILERRFAEGAISVDDYRERREVLVSGVRRGLGGAGDGERQAGRETIGEGKP